MGGGGKILASGVAYLESQVVDGVEDYVAAGAERPGRWVGGGAARLGLTGEISRDELDGVFRDSHALPVLAATRPAQATTTGYHQSLSPPKSVSVLWALGDERGTSTVEAAHAAAVDATIGWLEVHAAFARQGKGGPFQVDTSGLTVAVFDHRTSRAMDPQLHSHLLIANRVERSTDGAWRALDSKELWRNLKPGGLIYQAALRAELSTRLGVTWGPVSVDGQADIAGVPADLLARFSGRAATIDRVLGQRIAVREVELGRSLTAKEREQLHRQVTLDTRRAKDPDPITTSDLRARWAAEAAEVGLPYTAWRADVLDGQGRSSQQLALAVDGADLTRRERAAVIAALGEARSVWNQADLVNRIGPLAPASPAAGPLAAAWVDRNVSATLADHEVVRLAAPTLPPMPAARRRADGRPWDEPHGAARYTTRATLELEQTVMDAFVNGRDAGTAVVPRPIVKAACAGNSLDVGQAQAVERLLTAGDAVAVLVGPAGTGKTTALAAAATAWATAGLDVQAVAPSAVAAGVLADDTGLRSDTLAHWLHTAPSMPNIVVCDEAGMVSTRDLHTLVSRCHDAGAQLVLVGDPAQLGSIDAGGLFPLLARDAATLDTVHRFRHTWEGPASLALRNHDPHAIDTYDGRGRLTAAPAPGSAVDQALALWRADPSTLLLAGDRATVADLANAIRAERIAARSVEPHGLLTADGQTIGVGDRIVTLRNDRALTTTERRWVRNGDRWTVTGRHDDGALTVTDSQRGKITLPAGYVEQHVALSYALTVHKAQGVTVDRAALITNDALTAQLLYVGMTRGRDSNQAIVITDLDTTAADTLRSVLGRHRETQAAITVQAEGPDDHRLSTLMPRHHELRRLMADAGPDPRLSLVRANQQLQLAGNRLNLAERDAALAADNVTECAGRLEQADMAWRDASRPVASRLHPDRARQAQHHLDGARHAHTDAIHHQTTAQEAVADARKDLRAAGQRVQKLERDAATWQAWHTEHPDVAPALAATTLAIHDRTDRIRLRTSLNPGRHLTDLLGRQPRHGPEHDTWLDAATTIEAYRETWGASPTDIGRPPADRAQRHAWAVAVEPAIASVRQARVTGREISLPGLP